MFCKKCGNSIVENDRFCGHCGTKVSPVKNQDFVVSTQNQVTEEISSGEVLVKAIEPKISQPEVNVGESNVHFTENRLVNQSEVAATLHNEQPKATVAQNNANHGPQAKNQYSSEQIDLLKSSMFSFWNFFKVAFKKPYGVAQIVNEKHFINGLIILILNSLLIPATIYNVLKHGIKSTESFLGGYTDISSQLSFSGLVISPFFMILIVHFVTIGTSFLFLKGKKASLQFKEVVARYGTLFAVSLGLVLVAFILSYVSITLCLIFFLISLFMSISVVPLLMGSFQTANAKGIDSLYIISIIYIVTSITQMILLRSMILRAFESISELFVGSLF